MSKTKLKHASYSIKKLLDKAALSYESRTNYKNILNNSIKQLDELGYQLDNIKQLKQKHIYALVDFWKDQFLNVATIKNRMSTLRYACRLLGKTNIIKSNNHYDIGNRSYIPEKSKAIKDIDLNKINDPYIKISLQLQKLFGLRREECLKIIPHVADKGNHIELKSSWTKGGVRRLIPLTDKAQRDCLDKAKILCGTNSLIPQGRSYIKHRNLYDRLTHQAGFYNLHGLRHAYAQKRYLKLTAEMTNSQGWHSPMDGGKALQQMSQSEREIDKRVREIISKELGHSRINILKIYCG